MSRVGMNAREREAINGQPQTQTKKDLYALAAKARKQGRHGIADDLSSIAESLPIIEGRMKVFSQVAVEGASAKALGSSRGGGDGLPAEVRAALAIRDTAQRLRELLDDWSG